MNNPSGQQGLGLLLWLITPLITALLLRAFAGDGWKDMGLRPSLKGNLIWYVVLSVCSWADRNRIASNPDKTAADWWTT